MTLTLTLSAPYANFPAVIGFKLFAPMPEAVDELTDQNEWENGLMVGNGPFMMDAPRNDQEIVLVPNPQWDGTKYDEELGLPEQPFLDSITFRDLGRRGHRLQRVRGGRGPGRPVRGRPGPGGGRQLRHHARRPGPGRLLLPDQRPRPRVGGEENKLLRQAISQAIDRDEINEAVYEGTRTDCDGHHAAGHPRVRGGPVRVLRL